MGYLLYDHGDSGWFTYFKVFEVVTVVSAILNAPNEMKPGSGLAYSKFSSESTKEFRQVPSRVGMIIIYSPAALSASWFFVDNLLFRTGWPEHYGTSSEIGSLKVFILSAALCVVFVKRVLETVFLHHYSGKTGLSVSITISVSYFMNTLNMNLSQQKSKQLIPPTLDLTWVGGVFFFLGVLGNFYHHLLLRGLRKEGDRRYVVPEGGLFGVFVAPHYICEIVTFAGLTLIAQTYCSTSVFIFVLLYLSSRSYGTKKWYLKKIDQFPRDRWVLIPYVF